LEADAEGGLDAVGDLDNMPLKNQPQRVRQELSAIAARPPGNAI
jgi:hypothetical protein